MPTLFKARFCTVLVPLIEVRQTTYEQVHSNSLNPYEGDLAVAAFKLI